MVSSISSVSSRVGDFKSVKVSKTQPVISLFFTMPNRILVALHLQFSANAIESLGGEANSLCTL